MNKDIEEISMPNIIPDIQEIPNNNIDIMDVRKFVQEVSKL